MTPQLPRRNVVFPGRTWFARLVILGFAVLSSSLLERSALADGPQLDTFTRKQLTPTYYSEGANAGDLNHDGIADIVYGPYWFAGPDYTVKREIFPAVPQNVEGYANHFFAWVYDFNQDGWGDVLTAGFPGTPAFVYENPKADGFDKPWPKHQVFDWVSNESPQWTNIAGDDLPELVCTRDGFFGFATFNPKEPFAKWEFHPVSEQVTDKRFGHGLGVGDVNGDTRPDLLFAGGWFEQPETHALTSRWLLHKAKFSDAYGGADMYAYDVDGDGDNDIITSLAAHDFGLAWYEQVRTGDEVEFKPHLIMGREPSDNRYGLLFTELHSVNLVDMDGDGLKDIVTGKTYYSHHKASPLWDAGAVVYWFRLVRGKDGVDWVPYKADGEAGIGRQLSIADVNGDKLPDIVVGGMKGAHVLTHVRSAVDKAAWAAAQPKLYDGPKPVVIPGLKAARGPKSPIDGETGAVTGAIEGEKLKPTATGGNAAPQGMAGFDVDRWSGNSQLWWTGAKVGDTLSLPLPEFEGEVTVEAVFTRARDYGALQLFLDDQPLGEPLDFYDTEVLTTGVITFPKVTVKGKQHSLQAKIVGANPMAVKSYMFGLDYLRIQRADGKFVALTGVAPPAEIDAVRPRTAANKVLNLDFEDGSLKDWTATGDAFADQPIKGDTVAQRRGDMRSGHVGEYWIGGYERHGDQRQGTLISAPFIVSHPFASFFTNGGEHAETRVELARKDTGDVVYKVSGTNSETLRQVVVDLRAHMGKEIVIRLVDDYTGGWGHLNFDHFRFHEKRPANIAPLIVLTPDEYPHAGLKADAAAAAMKLPKGFTVSVGAAEPDVKQPIAMALDDRGRVWIAEAYEYPNRAQGDSGRDQILIFEDTNGDGTLDSRKVFATGLNLVSGLEVGFGGVWVGAAPDLLFIPDQNGDDKPDGKPQVLLDGWGYQDTHETLNAFIWGPDGWLYGCHGVFTHSLVGKPGTPKEQRSPINAGVWRYHPTRHEFEVFAHGTSNPWGVDFNDHGQAFITACVIPHLYHIVQGARYQRQAGLHFNQYTYRDITTIADHVHYLGATPHSGNNKSDAAGGGHAHAGAMIYLGDRWPREYRNHLFMNNIHGQRLNVDIPEPQGSGYVGRHGPDFLLTGDKASQILNLRYGPDGNAWMIDWYDMQACHTGNPAQHDRSNGRIYRISYGDSKSPAIAVNLTSQSDEQLAALVLHANDWYVRHARRLLQERAVRRPIEQSAINQLIGIATKHADETRRLRAAWALHVTNQLSADLLRALLEDANPYVRSWAVQLALEIDRNKPAAARLDQFTSMAAKDPSPVVRLYLAAAAQRIPVDQRWALLDALVRHKSDADDHNLPLMYWYAAEPLAAVDPARALAWAMSAGDNIPLLREFMLRRIGSGDTATALAVLLKGLASAKSPDLQLTFLESIRAALKGQRRVAAPSSWKDLAPGLLVSQNDKIRLQAIALGVTFGDPAAIQLMRARVADNGADVAARQLALQSLLEDRDPELVPTLLSLLKAEGVLRDASIRGLARYNDPAIAKSLLDIYPSLTAEQKRLALGTLASRAPFALPLLKAVAAKQVAGTDLTADLVRQMQYLKNAEVTDLLQSVWGTARESAADKLAQIASLKELVASTKHAAADLELGRAVFNKTCQKCHILYGLGGKVGPDLTGSNRSDLDYLLGNIVDPSAVMAKEYRPTIVATNDGRVLSGLLKGEDDKTLTLQLPDSLVVVAKSDIDERQESELSMMPDDQLKAFSVHEVRSLIAYLQAKSQTALLATPESAAEFFNGRDLSGWSGKTQLWSVENGEIVGRTEGLQQNEWLVSDLAASDFEWTLEVKLVGNEGNSGVQFRSRAHEGDVAGYQADIGPGWWGKLYEEHGRALLWDKSGEAHLKSGDWNTYVVRAEGSKIRTFLNGKPCVDLDDEKGSRRGIFALQLHSGGKTEVRFRNFKLKLLPEAKATASAP